MQDKLNGFNKLNVNDDGVKRLALPEHAREHQQG